MDFIHDSLDLIEYYMLIYGYWAVFFGVMLENAGLPIPGETILLGRRITFARRSSADAACYARSPLPVQLSVTISDSPIGHHFGRSILLRFGKYVFLTPERLEHMENYFHSHGNKTILVARFITGLRVFAALLRRSIYDAVARFFGLQRGWRRSLVGNHYTFGISFRSELADFGSMGRPERNYFFDRRNRDGRDNLAGASPSSKEQSITKKCCQNLCSGGIPLSLQTDQSFMSSAALL